MSTSRVLLPRIERAATILLEVCDFCLSDAVAAVLLAAEAHEREEILAFGLRGSSRIREHAHDAP